jgi:hypothetical protein
MSLRLNQLIRQGAKLVTGSRKAINELPKAVRVSAEAGEIWAVEPAGWLRAKLFT